MAAAKRRGRPIFEQLQLGNQRLDDARFSDATPRCLDPWAGRPTEEVAAYAAEPFSQEIGDLLVACAQPR